MLMWIPVISPIEVKLSAIPDRIPTPADTIEDAEYTVHEELSDEPGEGSSNIASANKARDVEAWRARLSAVRQQLKGDDDEKPPER